MSELIEQIRDSFDGIINMLEEAEEDSKSLKDASTKARDLLTENYFLKEELKRKEDWITKLEAENQKLREERNDYVLTSLNLKREYEKKPLLTGKMDGFGYYKPILV